MGNNGLGQVVSWYICTIAAVPFVALRMYARWSRFGKLAIEDFLIILALFCLIGDLGIQQHLWNLGMGDMSTLSPANLKGIMQLIVPGSILYVSSLWSVKFALVLFYKRLAATGSRLVLVYNIALGGLAATFLTIFFDILFQCYPYDKRWSTDPNYQCDSRASEANYWMTITFNIVSDVVIIALPITMVFRLQMKLKQKLGVVAMFALGSFVVISSIVRAYFSHRNETMLTCTVSMVENAIAVIAACLPALRSIVIGDTTQGASTSYGKHYELESGRRRTVENRMHASGHGASVAATTPSRGTGRDPNGSEDSLVASGLCTGLGVEGGKGRIAVETKIETKYGDTHSNAESSKSRC